MFLFLAVGLTDVPLGKFILLKNILYECTYFIFVDWFGPKLFESMVHFMGRGSESTNKSTSYYLLIDKLQLDYKIIVTLCVLKDGN